MLIIMNMLILLLYCSKDAILQETDSSIDLQINKFNQSHIILMCSCDSPPYGETAEFLINNVTVASITFSKNNCFIKRRACYSDECFCTSTQFNWTFVTPVEITSYVLTCQVRVLQEKHGRHLKVFATKFYNGTDIIDKSTYIEKICFTNCDSTEEHENNKPDSTDNTHTYIIIGTLIPVVVILVLIFLWKSFKGRNELNEGIESKTTLNEGKVKPDTPLLDNKSIDQEEISDSRGPVTVVNIEEDFETEDKSCIYPRSVDTYDFLKEASSETLASSRISVSNSSHKEEIRTEDGAPEYEDQMEDNDESNYEI